MMFLVLQVLAQSMDTASRLSESCLLLPAKNCDYLPITHAKVEKSK